MACEAGRAHGSEGGGGGRRAAEAGFIGVVVGGYTVVWNALE